MINDKLLSAMNEQIKNEMESAYLYLSMAAYFHLKSLDGMAHWMRCQAHEEMIHGMKFYDFVIERGATVTLTDLTQIKTNWDSPVAAWKETYLHEQKITQNINDLITLSRELRDYASEPILSWFANEQVEEEANTSKIVDQMEMVENNNPGIFMLDKELGSRAFPQGSPLDPIQIKNE